MTVVEQIQQAAKTQGEAAMASAQTLATSIQTIATAHADYAKTVSYTHLNFRRTPLLDLRRHSSTPSPQIGLPHRIIVAMRESRQTLDEGRLEANKRSLDTEVH